MVPQCLEVTRRRSLEANGLRQDRRRPVLIDVSNSLEKCKIHVRRRSTPQRLGLARAGAADGARIRAVRAIVAFR
jgi:hypothetical protein